jgi:hypothetical protein
VSKGRYKYANITHRVIKEEDQGYTEKKDSKNGSSYMIIL